MAQNNVKFFADERYFVDFDTSGTVNNIITIGPLRFAKPSDKTNRNPVFCSFKGVQMPQITEDSLDDSSSEDSFCYISLPNNINLIKIAVNKADIDSMELAKKYIEGLLVDYHLAALVPAGSNKEPLFEVSTYLSDGTLVSPSAACSLNDIVKKVLAFEANLDINEAGYYKHVITRSLAQK